MTVAPKLPKRLTPSPIIESDFEVRFNSDYPDDAVFGVVYTAVKELFSPKKPIGLPILQVPELMRHKDPNLRYQAYYRLEKGSMNLSIGPHSLVFGNVRPYIGWSEWSAFFFNAMNCIRSTEIILSHAARTDV